jgi:hypothetical protein
MARSTPIAQLKQTNQPQSDENELVNEILQELEEGNQTKPKSQPQPPKQHKPVPEEPSKEELLLAQQQQYEERMRYQQQEYEKLLQEQQQREQELHEKASEEMQIMEKKYEQQLESQQKENEKLQENVPPVPTREEIETKLNTDKELPLKDKILQFIKAPLVVCVIVLLLSLNVTTKVISTCLPNSEFIMNNVTIFTLLIKSLLGGSLFLVSSFAV